MAAAGAEDVEMAATAPAEDERKETPLYGGAMRAYIPKKFLDVSDLRDVPDHQEVFVDNDTDCSLIFELNALSDDVADGDIGTHIFTDLAEYNDAVGHKIGLNTALTSDSAPNFPSAYKHLVVGDQTVSKYNDGDIAANNVRVYMAIIRLRNAQTDIVMMLNVPTTVSEISSSFGALKELADADAMASLFLEVVKSFRIDDMGIFA
mmetsp:Transcript_21085/g.44036  ORF Transcript_21085/g.44036 Transcript_21085/m.44036 type:complete len:206 (-) Transcript_21085:38-655(-)